MQTQENVPASLCDWLFYSGSFMERLKGYGEEPIIQVLNQDWQLPNTEECNALRMDCHTFALVREVLITSGTKIWMFARTIFPPETLTGKEQELACLNNRSLGSVLFKDPTLKRSPFKINKLQPDMGLYHKVFEMAKMQSYKELWSRESLFWIQEKPLLLTEVFFPILGMLGDSCV